ncbi:MAG: 4Fe-4S dicluster domain-containing protein [Anaerolineales bacterium]|nr:4Fe-4S dicluster domain-containing protein [Anaerolineales bacterium]
MVKNVDGKPTSIRWQEDQCIACLSCITVCAEEHTYTSASSRSRIRIYADVFRAEITAEYCRQCRNAPCARACPAEAIRFNNGPRAWLIDSNLCTGCGLCVEACPFDSMKLDPVTNLAMKCDLCLGQMRCVGVCPSGALMIRGAQEEGR